MSIIRVERKVLEKNDAVAAENRQRLKSDNIVTINLLSSPGSGKTTLLEKTLEQLAGELKIGVIEGDVQTDNDAMRIARFGVPVVQIVTNGGCHLDAPLVRNAMEQMDLGQVKLLFIENVGNLVCPASYDLGEDMKVVIISTTEGDDKPLKYPAMFRVSDICVINKIDLLDYVDFSVEKCKEYALGINPKLTFFEVSARTGAGMEDWINWVKVQSGS
ncbi:MAG: hydrogenase nickel incorporation protein HypB [Calditrichia bacterium]